MQILKQGDEYLLKGSEIVTLFSMNNFVLNLDNNEKKREIECFSLFLLETDREEKISITNADTPVVITEQFL